VFQAGLGKKRDPISKITTVKRAEGVTQVVECLVSNCKALSLNPSTTHVHAHTPTPTPTQIHKQINYSVPLVDSASFCVFLVSAPFAESKNWGIFTPFCVLFTSWSVGVAETEVDWNSFVSGSPSIRCCSLLEFTN
jgi:hypothetical protein